MGRNKQQKLDEVDHLPNVFSMLHGGEIEPRLKKYFKNDNPFIFEIGCGDADYSRNMALEYPDYNYVGMDIRGARIWNASKKVEAENLENVAFVIGRAEFITDIFKEIKFDEIWLPFSDPFPRKRNKGRRLIHPGFLERYKSITNPGAIIHLKTDDDGLYEYGCEVLENSDVEILRNSSNLYSEQNLGFKEQIKTKYELMHLKEGKTIKLLSFRFK